MKTITVKLKIEPQKFNAAQQFMEEKGLDISDELSKTAETFYKKFVPSPVRKYIEKSTAASHTHAEKSSRSAPSGPSGSGSEEPDSGMDLSNLRSGRSCDG